MNIKKTALLTALVALTGAQCWGAADKPKGLEDLPPEVAEEITGYLDPNSLVSASQATRQLRDATARERMMIATLINQHDGNKDLALISAVSSRKTPIIDQLIQSGVDVVSLLIQAGADVNAVNHNGYPVLVLAAASNNDALQKLINAGATLDLDALDDRYGNTALITAAQYGRMQAVQQLLQAGANKSIIGRDTGLTAEQIARNYGHNEIADYIRDFQPLDG